MRIFPYHQKSLNSSYRRADPSICNWEGKDSDEESGFSAGLISEIGGIYELKRDRLLVEQALTCLCHQKSFDKQILQI